MFLCVMSCMDVWLNIDSGESLESSYSHEFYSYWHGQGFFFFFFFSSRSVKKWRKKTKMRGKINNEFENEEEWRKFLTLPTWDQAYGGGKSSVSN